MEWHAHSGLLAMIIEAPLELRLQDKISHLHFNPAKACIPPSYTDTMDGGSVSPGKDAATPKDSRLFGRLLWT